MAWRDRAGRRVVELAEGDDHRIGSGFVGTPLVCDALCSVGAYDTAYALLLLRLPLRGLASFSGTTRIGQRRPTLASRPEDDQNSFS
ncbi:alpha-L-rhamnosidase-related protein [Nonomuraea helvata]|uniref:Alpha-L-rhamnosidase six-hairpin glycosidase domain-containing protein n=1 Tax=Nonomuraea helvata TaxID=37484 RepID=A0ABV5SC39_9ACTN